MEREVVDRSIVRGLRLRLRLVGAVEGGSGQGDGVRMS